MASRKLLIVDDDAHVRALLALYFKKPLYEVLQAGNGEEAIEMVAAHEFDVILLDLILPHHGGLRLCQKFKKERRVTAPRIIVMTGDDAPETEEMALSCGADAFLGKPFSALDVRKAVEALF